jgi:hypothetical protein
MRTLRAIFAGALSVVMLLTVACSEKTPTAARTPAAAPFPVNFDRNDFDRDSANIDNEWWPLTPGTQFTWEGHAFEDKTRIERRVIFTVTDLTKEIAGIRVRVGWDRDFNDGKLGEGELIFLAQDKEGNVWHLGQYRETYDEEGEFVGGRVWIAGFLKGAKAGILMKAKPELGAPSYSQGFAPPPWNWDDNARVFQVSQKTCVPVGCYDDVLVIEEFEPTKPGASQLKYYARGVGNVRVGWRGEEEEEREEMVLVRMVKLSPAALAEARRTALELESRAYMYGRTAPAEGGRPA